MLVELTLLRHAISEDRGFPGITDDSLRPLKERGAEKMRIEAQGIARLGINFDLIISSPYLRARQTAEIVAEALCPATSMELFPPLAADVAANDAVTEIRVRTEGLCSVLIVGHEPQLSQVGSILLAGDLRLDLRLKKGGMFKLTCENVSPGSATLDWWLMPKHLRQLGN